MATPPWSTPNRRACRSSRFSLASSCACGMTIIRRRTFMSNTRVSKPSSKFGLGKSARGDCLRKQPPSSRNGACDTKGSCWPIGNMHNGSNHWNAFQEQIKMIKVIEARYCGDFQVSLTFSDGVEGLLNGRELLQRNGPLIDALRDESFFRRVFIDAGAICGRNDFLRRSLETCRTRNGMRLRFTSALSCQRQSKHASSAQQTVVGGAAFRLLPLAGRGRSRPFAGFLLVLETRGWGRGKLHAL